MQKKHLHLLLLVLIAGCSKHQYSDINPYFQKNKELSIESSRFQPMGFFWQGSELQLSGNSEAPEFRMTWPAMSPERFTLQWEAGDSPASQEAITLTLPHTGRSLNSLWVTDSSTGYRLTLAGLPNGNGAAAYFEGISTRRIGVSVQLPNFLQADSSFERVRENDDRFVRFTRTDRFTVLFAAPDGFSDVEMDAQDGKTRNLVVRFAPQKAYAIYICIADSPEHARKDAEHYLKLKAKDLDKDARTALADTIAFSLSTGDDRTNQATALLTAELAGLDNALNFSTRLDIENNSQIAAALFLASRQSPRLVFGDTPENKFGEQQKLAFGWPAYLDAVNYGMGAAETTRKLGGVILNTLEDQEFSDLMIGEVPSNFSAKDSAVFLANQYMKLAGLDACGEAIARSGGDHPKGDIFRKAALKDMRNVRRFYHEWLLLRRAERIKRMSEKNDTTQATLNDTPLTTEVDKPEPDDSLSVMQHFVRVEASNGFTLLDDDPKKTVFCAPMDRFTWLKWITYRFGNEIKLSETSDLDSLITLVVNAAHPGMLMAVDSEGVAAPDLLCMGTALQLLSEVYVGVQPDWLRHEVKIVPHIPANWGHTLVRVPFGNGFIHVEYDFVHDRARIGVSNVSEETAFVFAYPLPTGGAITTQFKLSNDKPKVEITFVRKQENMTELKVEDVK